MSQADAEWTDIHRFWFGSLLTDGFIAPEVQARWFKKSDTFDQELRDRFASTIETALAGGLEDWCAEPRSALCLVLLCDQFPRNIYRHSPRAFAGDARALDVARAIDTERLLPIERVFAYLPFEHSESQTDQDLSLQLFTELAGQVDAPDRLKFDQFLSFARRHAEIVRRYGRFPHRNAVLDRPSTPEEQDFLKQPGSGF